MALGRGSHVVPKGMELQGVSLMCDSLFKRHGVGTCLCWSSAGGSCYTRTGTSLTEKCNPTRMKGCGAWVCKLGSQYWHCAASHKWLCVYAGDMVEAGYVYFQLLCPQKGISKTLPLKEAL